MLSSVYLCRLKQVLLLLCFSSLNLSLWATDHGQAFAEGLQAYQQKDYDEAIVQFEKALEGDMKSAEAYNNLGLAYYQKGDLGYAILNFERAIRQNPYLSDARHNLKAAKQRMPIQVNAPKSFWLFKGWMGIVRLLSSNSWAIILWISLFLAAGAFIVWYNKLGDVKKNALALKLGIGLAIFSLLPMIWGFQASKAEHNKDNIIVVSPSAGVRSAPSLEGEDIMLVGAGAKGRIVEQEGEWNRIRLENGVMGWMPKKLMERI
jgi:tetratricopeptide (TPR) repeat protein